MTDINLARLSDPFPIQAVDFYPGPLSAEAGRCRAMPYIETLHLCRRLDAVVGPDRWGERYQTLAGGAYRCGVTLRLDGRRLTRWSRPHPDLFDTLPENAPFDGFTEAALKWGLGRYLTLIPPIWVEARLAPGEHGLPHVMTFDRFAARAQLARILAETGFLETSSGGQGGCPACARRQQLLFDIEELQITLNQRGDCLTLDWPAVRRFSVEKLVLFQAGLQTRLKLLFEDAPPPHLSARQAQAPARRPT